MASGVGVAACDLGPYTNQASVGTTPVTLVSSNLSTFTLDQPIVLSFNRFLDPNSVVRQSIQLQDSSGNVLTQPSIAYDPVTLSVTLSNPGSGLPWLTAGQKYRILLPVPTPEVGSAFGLMAIDGATLAAPMTLTFSAGAAATPPAGTPPTIDYCRDIQNAIFTQSCAYGGCHEAAKPFVPVMLDASTGYPRLGLDLSSPQAVRATAINQVADESNTGALSMVQAQLQGAPFGIDMAIIAAGDPADSWLMYKTLLATPAAASAEIIPFDAGPDAGADANAENHNNYDQTLTPAITLAEQAVLSNYILGQSMPYPFPPFPEAGAPAVGLTEGDIERLSLWIAQGAQTPPSCQ